MLPMKNKVSTSPHATLVVIFTNSDPWGDGGSALSDPPGDEELDRIQTPAIRPTPNDDEIGDRDEERGYTPAIGSTMNNNEIRDRDEERVTHAIRPAPNDDEIRDRDDDDENQPRASKRRKRVIPEPQTKPKSKPRPVSKFIKCMIN